MYSTTKGNDDYEFIFKVLLLGNSNVGKSSLFLRFVDDIWNDTFVPTIGVDFKIKTFDIDEKKIKMQIWDTAGQERFKNITASYYRGGNGVLVVYDITDRDSFENLNSWLIEIEKNANKNVYKLLIGNKSDLEDKRKVTYQEGKDFATSNGMQFIETSAKTDSKVKDAFELLTQEIIKASLTKDKSIEKKERTVHLSDNAAEISTKQKKACC
jgi:Ras-related protein Rab-1A